MLDKIIKNTVGHFCYFPKILGMPVDSTSVRTIIYSGLNAKEFNVICDTHLEAWGKLKEDIAIADFFFNPGQSERLPTSYGGWGPFI